MYRVAGKMMARIGDWRQIKNIRQLPAFLGLVPTERSTGERTDRGSITHSGDPRLRSKPRAKTGSKMLA